MGQHGLSLPRPNPMECNSVEDSLDWVEHVARHFVAKGILPSPTVAAELDLSTTCSGLEAPVVVARIATQAIAPNVTVKCLWACECNRACQEEMLQKP